MFKKLTWLTSFHLIFIVQLFSQTPSYYHYTSSDGLASSTVFSILQDRNGFIWYATLNGLSKFDGKHFTTFRTADGLNSNSITSLAEGNNGELFIGNYENGINVLKNGKIENYCRTINEKTFATSFLLLAPQDDGTQNLYTYRVWGTVNVIHEKGRSDQPDFSWITYPHLLVKLDRLGNDKIIALTTSGLYQFKDNSFTKLVITGLPDNDLYCLTHSNKETYWVGGKGMIFKIKNGNVISRYKINLNPDNNDVTAIFADQHDNVWFSIMNRGFYLITNGSDKVADIGVKMDLQNTLVNNYLEDSEGNIWVSTFGKGVYCLNNLYLQTFEEKDGLSSNNVYAIAREKTGKLLIGTFNGLNILENGRFDQVRINSGKTLTEYIYNIKNSNDVFYVCGTFGTSEMINLSYHGIKIDLFSTSSFCKTSRGLYLFGSGVNFISVHKYIHKINNPFFQYFIFGDSTNINRINAIYEDTEKNIWVGTGLGLCKIPNMNDYSGSAAWKKSFFPTEPVLNSKINSIFQVDKSTIWFASEKGIASYNLNNDSVINYETINGYDLSSSTSIVSDSQNRIWIGTMHGLFVFNALSVKYLSRQTGLPSDEVLSLCFDEEKNLLYIGTSNGISFLDINLFEGYVPPSLEVKISSFKAGDSTYLAFDHLVFAPKQNHVHIDFVALSYSSPGSVKYRYRLNGEWEETGYDFLDLVSLRSGKYELDIMAKSQNTDWGKPSHLLFEVKPFFIETVWFKLGGILLMLLISISFVIWRLKISHKKIRKELELNARINELKHQALSAMMNPHFIFNSLNSVQYLINSKRNEEANDYIAIMAKLVRKNLDTAGQGMILLSEEITRLNLYLELEKLRLQDGFSYDIITGANVDPSNVMIPNMIIQPFVENTLWHGIVDSGKKGELTISFSLEDIDIDSVISRSLIIKVTDNGIGINQARKSKKEDHISKGIQIIEERLRLLSAKMNIPQPILFEDLSSRNDHSQGTEVIISLPPQLYKILPPPSAHTD
ncbi:MAG: two-component regulator propeller domain-containing protein [Bacteroidales bacterium]|jgi:ligand-binding sensor domain-containing protein/two-component sensor histidine kinase